MYQPRAIARVERQRTIDQRYHGADVLAEISQHEGRVGQDARVVLAPLRAPAGQDRCLSTVRLRVFGPAVIDEPHVANRGPGECRPVMPIDRDRLFEQSQRLEEPALSSLEKGRKRAQIEVVGGRDRSVGRAADATDLGGSAMPAR